MKKFISFVMAAAMVASLVPATAFAISENGDVKATAKVVNAWSVSKLADAQNKVTTVPGEYTSPEVQLDITSVNYKQTTVKGDKNIKASFNLILDNADWIWTNGADFATNNVSIWNDDGLDIKGTWKEGAEVPGGSATTYDYTAGTAGSGTIGSAANLKAAYDEVVADAGTNVYGMFKVAAASGVAKDPDWADWDTVWSAIEEDVAAANRIGADNPGGQTAEEKIQDVMDTELPGETTNAFGITGADATGSTWIKGDGSDGTGLDYFICDGASDDGLVPVGTKVYLKSTSLAVNNFEDVTDDKMDLTVSACLNAYYAAFQASTYGTGYKFGKDSSEYFLFIILFSFLVLILRCNVKGKTKEASHDASSA